MRRTIALLLAYLLLIACDGIDSRYAVDPACTVAEVLARAAEGRTARSLGLLAVRGRVARVRSGPDRVVLTLETACGTSSRVLADFARAGSDVPRSQEVHVLGYPAERATRRRPLVLTAVGLYFPADTRGYYLTAYEKAFGAWSSGRLIVRSD